MDQDTDGCGCCGITPPRPGGRQPAGLAAIAYRSGTHGTILRRMLAALGSRLPQLDPTATDDPAIALLDAWATVANIVTFYQERIANEGFLRTATERRSVLELARAIGYELRPGVAAAAYLDFRMQVPAAAATAPVRRRRRRRWSPQGTKVLSVPAQGKLPQPFETGPEFTADAALNELSPAHPPGTGPRLGADPAVPGRDGDRAAARRPDTRRRAAPGPPVPAALWRSGC